MSKVSEFTNDNFRVLALLYDNKGKDNIVKFTQQEVADELSLSRVTINKIFKHFKENGYITQDKKRIGRYYLTSAGELIVETIRKTDEI